MNLGLAEKTATLRMAVLGCDYVTGLGLAQLLHRADFIDMVKSAADSAELLAVMEDAPVDLVLVDAGIRAESLAHACRALSHRVDSPTIVVMGDVPYEMAESLVFEGVSAILNHGLLAEDLPVALRMIHRGGALLLSDNAREAIMARSSTFNPNHRIRYDSLNTRERVVAQGVAEGMTNGELAASMHMSEATVKLLVSNVMNKLGASNRVQVAVVVTKAHVA